MRISESRKRKALPGYRYLGCPLTKNRSPWCFRMCRPSPAGYGKCGRHAPNSFVGRIQSSIIVYDNKKTHGDKVRI